MSCVRLSGPCVPDPPDCLSVAHPGSIVGTVSLLEFLEEPPVLRMEIESPGWGPPLGEGPSLL